MNKSIYCNSILGNDCSWSHDKSASVKPRISGPTDNDSSVGCECGVSVRVTCQAIMDEANLSTILCVHATDAVMFYTAICCRSDGHIMAINGGTNRVLIYSESGVLLASNFGNRLLNRRFIRPSLITELANKRVAIFDSSDNKIKKLSWSEDLVDTFDIGCSTDSLSTNSYGHMVLSHHTDKGQSITIRHPDNGAIIRTILLPPNNQGVYGPVYACMNGPAVIALDHSACQLSLITMEGRKEKCYGKRGFVNGHMDAPTAVCLDWRGQALVTDCHNDRVQRYDLSNGQCQTIIQGVKKPLAVNFDRSGQLVVMNARSVFIYQYDLIKPMLR